MGSRMVRALFPAILIGFLFAPRNVSCGQGTASTKPSQPSTQRLHYFSQVSISPDGQFVTWNQVERLDDSRFSEPELCVADLRSVSGAPKRIVVRDGKTRKAGHGAAWSPDGMQLAFLCATGKSNQLHIYVSSRSSDQPKQLTHLAGAISDLRWSPDGKSISYLFIENPSRAAGPTSAVPPQTGVVGKKSFVQRIGIVDVASGHTHNLSPSDLYVYEYAWSRDGQTLAAIAAHPPGDDNWYQAQLFTLPLKSGIASSVLKTSMQIGEPCWSPDGKSIAFIGGLMSDEGLIGGDIFCVDATGGTPRNLTPGLKASSAWLTWPSSNRILFTEQIDGGSGICTLDPTDGRLETLWKGDETIGAESYNSISVAADGKTTALVRQTFERPPEVWTGAIGDWKQRTQANAHVTPEWGNARNLHWKSDKWTVQGWLLYPKDYNESRRYPMVVMPHGGPAWQYEPSFAAARFFHPTAFSSRGAFVFLPNPRGSYGQGEEFTRGNVRDFGYGDLRDILAGVDEIQKTLPVDKNRLGVAGWSYGGYMTMWAVTQTDRFHAAVAGAGIANWQSYYGENGIDQWMIPYFGASVYDDPAVYAKSSPINFIKQVKTPTLIVVGEYDQECPAPQSHEFWHGLKTCGVPSELVVYAGEGHYISKPEHQRDIMKRMMDWFDKYLAN
jgi:dipeptidyl aminopeptidase/acylaminoacyl peptidase